MVPFLLSLRQFISDYKMLVASNLSVGYYTSARSLIVPLSNVSLELDTSRLTCIVGNNGSGKSTLIRTMAGLQKPVAGSVSLNLPQCCHDIHSLDPRQLSRYVSVVLTDRLYYDNLTAFDVVSTGRSPYNGLFASLSEEDLNIIRYSFEVTGTANLQHRMMNELSDGERQKILVAKSIAQQTPVILLDEPSAFLDYQSKTELMRLLARLAHEEGRTILISSHDLDIVGKTADIFWVIENGEIHVSNSLTF